MNSMRNFAYAFILLAAASRGVEGYDNIRLLDPIKFEGMVKPVAAAASQTRLYVLDGKKSELFVFDANGVKLKSVGSKGNGPQQFSEPRGVAVGPDGRVYVADTGNSRVHILDAEGQFLSAFGSRGSDPGHLKSPEGVSIGQDGRIYVADTGNNRVQVFTDTGILLFHFGMSGSLAGQFKSPTKVVVDQSDGIYVLDEGNGRVQRFDASAKFTREFTFGGHDIAVDSYGFLYVLDGKAGKVAEVGPDGSVLGRFGSSGTGPGQMKRAEGIAVAADGSVLIVDTGNGRLHRAELTNQAKVATLPLNLETKVLASGPSKSWEYPAEGLAMGEGSIYAWLPKDGVFAVIGEDGREKSRIGGKSGGAQAATKGTRGFAFSPKHGLVVSDTANRLQHFAPNGTWKQNMAESTGMFDSKKKEGRVSDPRGVAISEKGTIYVAVAGNRRVDAFNTSGVYLFGIGPNVGSLTLEEPTAVAWDKSGAIFIVDRSLKKIIKCQPSGAYIASWGMEGDAPGQFKDPVAAAFDGNNYLYVLDAKHRRVSVFDKDGKWMTDLFSGGDGSTSLIEPVGLAVNGSKILIADKGRSRILTFDARFLLAAPSALAGTAKKGTITLTWKAGADSWADGYKIMRSTNQFGPFDEIGESQSSKFEDTNAPAPAKIWYRVATKAKTGDMGVPTPPIHVEVEALFNKAVVELSTVTLGNIFSANYKWYLKNPLGTATITNNVNVPFENVKVSFRLKDFMDFSYDTEIKRLKPQEIVEVPLIATLNNKILEVTEDTPVQAELTLTYFEEGKQTSVSMAKPLRVYSRNAITWENPNRIATFVTPKDPPVLDFVLAAVPKQSVSHKADALSDSVVTAMHVWQALSEYGVGFVDNPSAPYAATSQDQNYPVDYTQFPRETLKRKSGQCDELSTLLVTMLQGKAVGAALVDYPGHMAMMFDTGTDDLAEAGFPESKLVKRNGTWWVPVEATMIGQPFHEAVAKAAQAYKAEDAKGKVKVIDIAEARKQFEPATMPATDWSPEPPKMETRRSRFEKELAAILDERYSTMKSVYEKRLKERPNEIDTLVDLGLLEFQAGKDEAAAAQFNKVLAGDPKNAAALNNLGNLAFLKGDYPAAEKSYLAAAEADAQDSDLLLNLVRVAAKQKDKEKAAQYAKKVTERDPRLGPTVEAWMKGL